MARSIANAIMGGLAVASLLTLVLLPALYVTWFRIKSPSANVSHSPDLKQPTTLSVGQ